MCKEYGAANVLYVSIHVNAAGADGKWHGAGGWCCYTSKGRTMADSLAECMYDAAFSNLKEYVKIMDEGKRRGDYTEKQTPFRMDKTDGDRDLEADLYVVRKAACPAVLTENLFQDNKRDVAFLLSDEGRHAIERLHVEGIIDYIQKYMS
jgi:N-acetylmuramoyl-L-alanine amidase